MSVRSLSPSKGRGLVTAGTGEEYHCREGCVSGLWQIGSELASGIPRAKLSLVWGDGKIFAQDFGAGWKNKKEWWVHFKHGYKVSASKIVALKRLPAVYSGNAFCVWSRRLCQGKNCSHTHLSEAPWSVECTFKFLKGHSPRLRPVHIHGGEEINVEFCKSAPVSTLTFSFPSGKWQFYIAVQSGVI